MPTPTLLGIKISFILRCTAKLCLNNVDTNVMLQGEYTYFLIFTLTSIVGALTGCQRERDALLSLVLHHSCPAVP